MRLRFQKGDMIAIAAVVVLAAIIFAFFLPDSTASGTRAEIYLNGKLVRTVSLNTPQQFTLSGSYQNTITVSEGKIAVTQSNCPGKDCINCGWADSPGKLIVCLPNGLEIRIIADNNDVDFVVG